jgi:hypothetical protein
MVTAGGPQTIPKHKPSAGQDPEDKRERHERPGDPERADNEIGDGHLLDRFSDDGDDECVWGLFLHDFLFQIQSTVPGRAPALRRS